VKPAERQIYWNVSTLAKKLDVSSAAVNLGLINLGFQKPGAENPFELTKAGEQFGKFVFIKSKNGTRLKWQSTVMSLLKLECEELRKPREEMRYAYILELENGCYYVGSTTNLKRRFREHFTKKPKIKWIVKNPVVKVAYTEAVEGSLYDSYSLEDRLSLGLARTLGVSRVRGGKLSGHPDIAPKSWFSLINSVEPICVEIFTSWSDEKLMDFIS